MSGLGILAGPGVHRAGCVPGLQRFAAEHRCGVVNTWGAKGLFRWDSPFHFGSAGIQERDFELALFDEIDVLVTTGLDEAEVTTRPWEGRAEVIDITPEALFDARDLPLPPGTLDKPPLITALAAMVQGLLAEEPESGAVHAANRVVAASGRLQASGAIVAEPGLVGLWVARTFPSSVAGSVIVPNAGGPEAAWAQAAAIAREGRQAILIAGSPPPASEVEGVDVEVWDAPDVILDAAPLIEIAGPILAW